MKIFIQTLVLLSISILLLVVPGNMASALDDVRMMSVAEDNDNDGYGSDVDCDDNDSSVYPGASELCDSKDNDCNGTVPADEVDTDGDGFMICEGDCDDANAQVNPNAYELPGDIVDDNCDGSLGACDPNAEWKNHGQFVRCVAHETDALIAAGYLTQEEGDELISSAAQSDVGKKAGDCSATHIIEYWGDPEWTNKELAEDGNWDTASTASLPNKFIYVNHPYDGTGDRYWKYKYACGGCQWIGFYCYNYDLEAWQGINNHDCCASMQNTRTDQLPSGCLDTNQEIQLRVVSPWYAAYYEGEIVCEP